MSNHQEREVIDLTGDDDMDEVIDSTNNNNTDEVWRPNMDEIWRLGQNLAHVQETICRLEAARRAHDQQAYDAAVAAFVSLPGNRFEDEIHVFEDGTIADWYNLRRRQAEAEAAHGRPFTPPPHNPFDDLEWDDDGYPIYPDIDYEAEAMAEDGDDEDSLLDEDEIRNPDLADLAHLALQNAAEPAADPNAQQEQVTIDAGWQARQNADGNINGVEVYHNETVATAGFDVGHDRDLICRILMDEMTDLGSPHLPPAPNGTRRVMRVKITVEEFDADDNGEAQGETYTYNWQKQRVTIESGI
ncbi:hypothetical protein HII31_06488 [Pseudocercospora fuligena]|uniref:Uncharacterized protein n=1 Tax=Pseudocercospora fuligena TaxID=685502 RepID=A0A8H6VIX6_9PEZI|nr:hypothetical protein HII31_06488 [Pseudocercospora fuligena]